MAPEGSSAPERRDAPRQGIRPNKPEGRDCGKPGQEAHPEWVGSGPAQDGIGRGFHRWPHRWPQWRRTTVPGTPQEAMKGAWRREVFRLSLGRAHSHTPRTNTRFRRNQPHNTTPRAQPSPARHRIREPARFGQDMNKGSCTALRPGGSMRRSHRRETTPSPGVPRRPGKLLSRVSYTLPSIIVTTGAESSAWRKLAFPRRPLPVLEPLKRWGATPALTRVRAELFPKGCRRRQSHDGARPRNKRLQRKVRSWYLRLSDFARTATANASRRPHR